MSVVHKTEIKRRLNLSVDDKESIVITPLLHKDEIFRETSDIDSIDLRLGNYFLLPQVPPLPFTYPSKDFAKRSHIRVHVPMGNFLVVPAHETVLGATLEFIKLPCDLAGEILTKSSVARTFMVIETAPWIHPFYRGCLTLEIANVSNTPLVVYPGRLIGQLILMHISGEQPCEPKLCGTYLAPIYPEAPIFQDPADDLRAIGVEDIDIKTPFAAPRGR
jgi:dCTP deaminase